MFENEIAINSMLNHPNIVKMVDAEVNAIMKKPSTQQEWVRSYIATEYCSEGDLFNKIKTENGLSQKLCKSIFTQVLNGVEHMHSKGIAHWDLKVENILIHEDGSAKICDFGLATIEETSTLWVGTEAYMAPEVNSGERYEPKQVDLFSLGVILFVMATCSFPYRRAHESDQLFRNIVDKDFNSFWTVHESVSGGKVLPDSMKLLITDLLSIDPEERPDFDTIWMSSWFTSERPPLMRQLPIEKMDWAQEDLEEVSTIASVDTQPE